VIQETSGQEYELIAGLLCSQWFCQIYMLDTGKSNTEKKKIFSNLLHKTPLQQKKFDQRSAKKKPETRPQF
jgi:uncharacterized protein YggL (DUF469 family)